MYTAGRVYSCLHKAYLKATKSIHYWPHLTHWEIREENELAAMRKGQTLGFLTFGEYSQSECMCC